MDNKNWKVSHFWNNPSDNTEHFFSSKAEAIQEAKIMQSDDPNDSQVTYIENTKTGAWGKRTWGKRNIDWVVK